MANDRFFCPNCNSDNIQSFKIAYHSGVSTSSHSTVGVGYSNGGFGVGTAETTGVSVSNLSQSVAPPEKKGYLKNFFIGYLIVCVITYFIKLICESAVGRTFIVIDYFAIACLLYWFYKEIYCWNRDIYPKLLYQWNHSYICLRCGHRFIIN